MEKHIASFAEPLRQSSEVVRRLEQAYRSEIEKQNLIAAQARRME